MKFIRHFTRNNIHPFEFVDWIKEDVEIKNDLTNEIIFKIKGAEMPANYDKNAREIFVSKYFKMTEVPVELVPVSETNGSGRAVPDWLRRREPVAAIKDLLNNIKEARNRENFLRLQCDQSMPEIVSELKIVREKIKSLRNECDKNFTHEKSAKQVFHRLAGFWTYWGWMYDYFSTEDDARIFYEETIYTLECQIAAPNTPQFFNSGIHWAYGIEGDKRGLWRCDPKTYKAEETQSFYQFPGVHACVDRSVLIYSPRGIVTVGDIVDGRINEVIFDGKPSKVVATVYSGVDEILGLQTASGRILRVTAAHKLPVIPRDNHKRHTPTIQMAGDIKIGDYLQLELIEREEFGEIDDPNNAALIGWLQTDGYALLPESLSFPRLSFSFVNEDERLWITSNLPGDQDFSIGDRSHQCTGTKLQSIRLLKNFDFTTKLLQIGELLITDPNRRVPEYIRKGNKRTVTAYLKSVFQADGCISKTQRGTIIRLVSNNKQMLVDVMLLLQPYGIYSVIKQNSEKRKNRNAGWVLIIGSEKARKLFCNQIGFVSRDKIDKLNYSFDKPGRQYRNVKIDRVVGISVVDKTDVYDIQTECGMFQANGFRVCNCHIIGASDSLFDESGIYDNLTTEAKAFAIGGGVGRNSSNIRSKYEYLRTGGKASGSMEFAMIDDKSAGTIKSGSSQRRAAKMVIKDMDDPEVPEFIEWKFKEEKKVEALAAAGYDASWEGEAYKTVSGQNSNNSVRVPDSFIKLIKTDSDWQMTSRTTGEVVRKIKVKDLWKSIIDSCWASGDPGVQFDSTIQAWDTCPGDGRIRASNPCGEYLFKDNTSCNLAGINLQKLFNETSDDLKIADFLYVCAHWLTVLDISINASQLPSKLLAEGTIKYRTTGLGHTGLGAVLTRSGIQYDSSEACNLGAAVTALMTAQCYVQSAKLAKHVGAFPAFKNNKSNMLRVIRNHKLAASGNPNRLGYENIKAAPLEINHSMISKDLSRAVNNTWDKALRLGILCGFRNAFVTVIQPSGTTGIVMGCDTMSVEPDYRLVKVKRLSGGNSMRVINGSIKQALKNLEYTAEQIEDIEAYVTGNNTLDDAPFINRASLSAIGIIEKDIDTIEKLLDSAIQLRNALKVSGLSAKSKEAIGLPTDYQGAANIFMQMNFTKEQYLEATKWICGHGTLEGAPYLKPEHLPIFDCAMKSGFNGKRFLRWEAHINMINAISPFVSGGISKTLNLPNDANKKDIEDAILHAYNGGSKGIAIYRDGSKKSQPLINPYDISWWDPMPPNMSLPRGVRRRAPTRRNMLAHEVTIKDPAKWQKVVIKFGEYDDGSLAEIWIEVTKDIPSFHFAMKWASRAISNAIQYGAPLSDICRSYSNEEGGPSGRTDHPYITYCKSVIDLAIKLAMLEFDGDITFCKRKPPLHEIRCGKLKAKGQNGNEEVILEEKSVDLLRPIDNRCSKCGSSEIEKYPCPVCIRCGAQLGGCSV